MPHEGSGASTSGDANISETTAAFSPSTIAGSSLASRRRSALIVRRKSPLLAATPPTVTRALAYSHPYIVFLTRLLGLLTWTTGDPWESYLVVAAFWFLVLHGDFIILCGGPLLLICGLIFMLYSRYSPPSSSKDEADAAASGRTLDEVVETLREFTTKCNILVEPLLDVMDFLATQQKATSASARPAMTVLLG
ncbi:peroxisome- protein, partial [Ascosphaera atra]